MSSFDLRTGTWSLIVGDADVLNANSGFCAPSTVSGIVQNQSQGNNPVAGINVDLYKQTAPGIYELWLSDVTGVDGAYLFDKLLPGEYKLSIAIPTNYRISTDSDGSLNSGVVDIDVTIAALGDDWEGKTTILAPSNSGSGLDDFGDFGTPPGGGGTLPGSGVNLPGSNLPIVVPPAGNLTSQVVLPVDEHHVIPDIHEQPMAEGDIHDDVNPPGGSDINAPPVPHHPEYTLIPGDYENTFIEINENGVSTGMWFWDEDLGIWVFDETSFPLAYLPKTGVGAYPTYAILMFGFSLIGMGFAWTPKKPYKPKHKK